MNYELLLQKLNVQIEPLDKNSEVYNTITNLIYKGQQIDNSNNNSFDNDNCDNNRPYRIECVDIFNASRPSDSKKSFTNKDNFKQSLLWYGCFNSSVAAKLLNGIQPQFTNYTSYKAVSLWDNIIGCTDNINMGKFYKDTNGRYKSNRGILMLVEVNYSEKIIPCQIKIDSIKSEDYTRETLNYNEDDDTEDEADNDQQTILPITNKYNDNNNNNNDDDDIVELVNKNKNNSNKNKNKNKNNNNNNNKKEKYVYCKEIKDEIGMNQILQITGELSPNPNHAVYINNLKIPNGPFIPSTKTIKGNGWLNGYLKIWDKYNQFLIPSDKMIKLKYLVIVETRPTKNYKPFTSPSKSTHSITNNNINKSPVNNKYSPSSSSSSPSKSNIWDSVLVKKRSNDDINNQNNNNNNNNNNHHSFIVLEDDDNNNQKVFKKQKI